MPARDILHRFRTNELARFVNSHRIFFYALVSLISVSAVIVNALKNYSNFYSVAIYLSKSSRSVLVLANFGVLLALLCGHIVQRIFFGSLRPNEIERLYDRLWFFITESLLAFTIFRDEFDTPFALMFGFLLFVKSFHWLASDRIEWMDQRPYPGPPLSFHFRMTILFVILWTTDCLMFLFAIEHTLTAGVGGMVLFASEYGILMASVMNTILKYLLSTYDLRRAGRRGGENAPPWENKSMWIFYIELATDFLKLTTYLVFFIIIITFYGLPLNILRDVYITARSFITRLRALHRYQTATRNMDQRYPNATEDELTGMSDRTCIICREEMSSNGQQGVPGEGPNTTPKKLPCGHIFHFHCLRSWLERQQSCPTCRRNVLETATITPTAAPPAPANAQNPPMDAQRVNAIAPGGAQNLGQVANNNNPLGFIGRLFGPPPGVPDLGADRQVAQNDGQPDAGVAGQVNGILGNYQAPPQLQLQVLPPYPGFVGPEGVWQPWPALDAAQRNVDVTLGPSGNEAPGTSIADEGLPSSSSQSDSSGVTPSASATSQGSSNGSDSRTAREAAAQAALRRLGINNLTESSSATASRAETNGSSTLSTKPIPADDSVASTHVPVAAQVPVPKLIPLNYFRTQPTPNIPLHTNQSPALRSLFEGMPQNTQQGYSQSSRSNNNPSRLPPTLTDEQLASLDLLTRESIDERLRILEGVSGAVYRCIDDLMRVRSSLPTSTTSSAAGSASTIKRPADKSTLPTNNERSEGSSRGKEKKVVPESPDEKFE